jgi:hypothetical protein
MMDFDDYDECLSEETLEEEVQVPILPVSSFEEAMKDYERAGEEAFEDEGAISIASHSHLLSDEVHYYITEVLSEVKLPFTLSDFQLISLHILGSGRNLMIVSPTGSGKTIVIYLGILLLRRLFQIPEGVAIITEPLNMIMSEKLCSSIIPTGVISMTGELKTSLEEKDGVSLSAPEEMFVDGSLPCLFGHPESWLSDKGKQLIKVLHKKGRILMMVTDEMTCSLNWANIR